MDYGLLKKICDTRKINIDHFTCVSSWIDDAYRYVWLTIFNEQGTSFPKKRCNVTLIRLSVSAINKRLYFGKSELIPEDYTTNGRRYIYELKR